MTHLPTEILLEILSNVPGKDVIRLKQVNKQFNSIISRNWKKMQRPAMNMTIEENSFSIDFWESMKTVQFSVDGQTLRCKGLITENWLKETKAYHHLIEQVEGNPVRAIRENDELAKILLTLLKENKLTDSIHWAPHEKRTNHFVIANGSKLAEQLGFESETEFYKNLSASFVCGAIRIVKGSMYLFQAAWLKEVETSFGVCSTRTFDVNDPAKCFNSLIMKYLERYNCYNLTLWKFNDQLDSLMSLVRQSGVKVNTATLNVDEPDQEEWILNVINSLSCYIFLKTETEPFLLSANILRRMYGRSVSVTNFCAYFDEKEFISCLNEIMLDSEKLSFTWEINIKGDGQIAEGLKKCSVRKISNASGRAKYQIVRDSDGQHIHLSYVADENSRIYCIEMSFLM